MLIHSGESPHESEIGNKTFNQLKRHIPENIRMTHMVIHTGERPHEYPIRNKYLSMSCNLIPESVLLHAYSVVSNVYVSAQLEL